MDRDTAKDEHNDMDGGMDVDRDMDLDKDGDIDRIMERPDSADFWIGMWGQIFNRDSQLVEDEEN